MACKETVAVVGVGRVGLPLALHLADKGFQVVAVDNQTEHIQKLQSKIPPFTEEGIELYLEKYGNESVSFTTDLSRVQVASILILTLGTPLDSNHNPNTHQIDGVLESLIPYLRRGQALFLRSTVAPGTTERLAELIQKKTHLTIGVDFYLAFCPERISEGNALKELPKIPQIVGGVEEVSTHKAREFFLQVCEEVLTSDSKSAELAKLFSNMYRYISFAISNEFTMIANQFGRDIFPIVDLVNTNYPRAKLPKPGFAAGPCLYKDGFFLIENLPYADLITTSWRINEGFPGYLVRELKEKTSLKGKTVTVLGLSFKRDVDDTRNSLSYKLIRLLKESGAEVLLHDPHVKPGCAEELVAIADVVILAVDHSAYRQWKWDQFTKFSKPGSLICDVWNIFGGNQLIFENKSAEDPFLSEVPTSSHKKTKHVRTVT